MAQALDNMVYNPSFEEYSRCPERIDALGVMTAVDAWWQPTAGSSDYFNACGGRECQVPRNKMGVQNARTGLAYCGIYCSQEHYREYLQTELRQPLVAGRHYRVSFWVSLAEKSPYAVAPLGAFLTPDRISDTTWDLLMHRESTDYDLQGNQSIATFYTPQVVYDGDSAIVESNVWVEVSGDIVASGGERFLTIGNFASFNRSRVTRIENGNSILPGAYYYIDDVSVLPLDDESVVAQMRPSPVKDEIITMWDVFFATGESKVLPQSYNELHRLRELLEENPGMVIELRGHTDNQGTVEFNQRLSEARAKAVADYLIGRGVDARRISHRGFGESKPIESNDSAEGRRRNRRVEYRVVSK
jgi:outer membrane protein OmpA-like peptidoglycan-associated protein